MDLESVYNEYHSKVLSYVRGKVNNSEDAEDITADVFLKIQKKLEDYDEEKAAVSTWVYTIARNSVIDFYRCNRTTDELPDELSDELASEDETDSSLLRRETLQELGDALKKLCAEERSIIILHYYDGLSLTEIQKKMGLSYGQVKLRHNSALKEMRKFFSKKAADGKFSIL